MFLAISPKKYELNGAKLNYVVAYLNKVNVQRNKF